MDQTVLTTKNPLKISGFLWCGREYEKTVQEPGALAKTDAMDAMDKALGNILRRAGKSN